MLPLKDLHSQLDEALNVTTSDSMFSHLLYTDLINEQRSLFVRNEYNRKRELDASVQQTINCLPLELVDPHNCCVDIPIGCKILRSVDKIPNTIELFHTKTLTSVGPVDITLKRFSIINYSRVPYVGNGRTTSNSVYVFLYDDYIYVFSKKAQLSLLKSITLRGIFEDPTELASLNSCEGKPCWSASSIYPLNQWMWAYIKPTIVNSLLQRKGIPIDDTNNSSDDVTGESGGGRSRATKPTEK